MSDYFYEKSKFYYEKYKAGKLTRKVGAIIKDGDKYLTLIKNGNKAMFAGGSVDDGETTRHAVVREVLEETGAKIIKLKYLHREYYSVDWEFEGIVFPNKRVSYTYLCEVEKGNLKAIGLEGEFDKNITLRWCTSKELEELKLYKVDLELVKKIEKENIEI
ncbi:MAG: NUDIX hydrolase [Clostridia bacterium]|nr:NUDIX hydrolase [Clostridia bacterium]